MISKYGGWPLGDDGGNWKSDQFNFMEVKKDQQIDGFYVESIFQIGFEYFLADDKRNIFYVNKSIHIL